MRRGLTTYTTARAAITACVLCAGILALLSLGGLFPAVTLMLMLLSLGPACLMIVGFTAGFLPMGICLAAMLAALFRCGGARLLGFGAVYLLPVTAAFVLCLMKRVPFWRACGYLAGILMAEQLCVYLLLQSLTGNSLYLAAGGLAAQAINGMSIRDDFLYSLISMGLLAVPETMRDSALVAVPGGYALSQELVEELLLQVRSYVGQMLEALTPSALVSGSGLNALLGLSLGIHWGKSAAAKRAFKRDEPEQVIPDLDMPPLRRWYIPRPWGLRIGLMALGLLLTRVSVGGSLYMLGAIMTQVFTLCFGVQGLAALNDSQHRRGTGKTWRRLVVALALVLRFMQIALVVLGVMDQLSNTRGLRPPLRFRDEEE